ncbi:MAG: hypothetical protein GC180_09425 [Bacteroidetes bacterium]|nr:hypothetical protein [Bacteroidota bacterium]
MKRAHILFLIIALSCASYGQNLNREILLKRKQTHIKQYDTARKQANQYFLKMEFNGYRIINPIEHAALLQKQIERIELYYTDFQVSDSFKQSSLNGKRLEELEKLVPTLHQQTGIVWRFIGQTGAKSSNEAQSYYHGFVITYRDLEFIDRKEELVLLDSVSSLLSELRDTVVGIECQTKIRNHKKWTGKYLPNDLRKRNTGIRYKRRGLIARRKREYLTLTKTITHCDTLWSVSGKMPALSYMADSTVTQVLERKMKDWGKAMVVTDVTGSMYPYVLQLQIWMRLNFHTTDCRNFVFFNDGNKMHDRSKRAGKVGGIYSVKADNYIAMEIKCKEAMKGGDGGDGQENDIEAMLEAQRKYPECKEIILIADNYSPVRDMILLRQLKRPVHIILCGTQSGFINVEYLQIAYETGGSVHTIEEDIENMARLSEGEEIEIAGQRYKIQNGKFNVVRGT